MSSTKDYRDFIIDQLSLLEEITYKPMMGEFLIYYKDTLIGGIYDDRFLVKITETNKKYNLKESIPYESAKPMYMIEDVDNKELLKEIVIETYKELKIRL